MLGTKQEAHDNANILATMFGTGNNVNNPVIFANALFSNNSEHHPLQILTQNWG